MNEYQQKMWEDLTSLTESNEAFYYGDHELDGHYYRIFNYRLASYTDFQASSATECRGHAFEVTEEGENAQPIRLAALPMEKFWNVNENPFTMDLDFKDPLQIMLKEDGSLISTFLHDGHVRCKSKGSLLSDQAVDSTNFIDDNLDLKAELYHMELLGYTVNMEYTAPHNRIVIGYEKENLVVLNVRDRATGMYISRAELMDFPIILSHWVTCYDIKDLSEDNMDDWVQSIDNMEGIEGFVIQLATGQHVKKKTQWYLALHHTKDSINNPRRLFEAVLEETSDDLRTMFADDTLAIKQIEEMEQRVDKIYNHMVDQVERFYEHNKHLDRKEYAICGQEELDRMCFGLAMSKYVGKEVDYKSFLKGKWKQLGFNDQRQDNQE